ncbi:hypothetical protein IQ244_05255 [Nostoc sp. LEGE 06077]|uniref:hypothetical protein n=1 Tax=Nostoc sp. LEGE 06077 TaxID=915325 RepID=UPI00187E5581|nr:hypothetical protein [Nostoc sp. LEGE 06077]MBE9205928.1 hypothetical protein [Nostoc sp. LEGE 06077]
MPTYLNQDFCFCTLAFQAKYRNLAKELAETLEKYSSGTTLVIGTDQPEAFQNSPNVFAFKLHQTGILYCYHDKRFVIQEALKHFPTAIQIDADTKIVGDVSQEIPQTEGLAAGHIEDIVEHVQKYNPERLIYLRKIAAKLDLSLDNVSYVGESLFAVTAHSKKSEAFIKYWDAIARYLEIHGIHSGEGNAIGMAAAKAGLKVYNPLWLGKINSVRKHLDASDRKSERTQWEVLQRKLAYHYRLNKARIISLKDFDFFYS